MRLALRHLRPANMRNIGAQTSGAQVGEQRGFFSIDLSLALLISTLIAVMTFNAARQAADASVAGLQADALMAIRGASHRLVMANYGAYQSSLSVTRNGVTLANGTGAGQSRNPTVANLRAMDLGVNNALDFGVYKSLTGAGYDINITLSPACATAPASTDCHVTGLVCLNAPLKDQSSASGEVDAPGQGVMLGRMGGGGGTSLLGSAGTITAADGSWSAINPYGAIAGIMCARFGWGSESDDYLHVGDSRDPNFSGGETISGTLAGSVNTLQVNGNAAITQDLSVDGAGGIKKLLGQVQVYGDKIVNNTGTASIDSTGTVTGASVVTAALTLNNTATLGSACAPDAAAAWASSAGRWTFARCSSGTWTSVGGAIGAVVGSSCSPYGAKALDANGAELMCTGSVWQLTTSRIGRYVLYASYSAANGDTVDKPICTTGSTGSAAYLAIGSDVTAKFQRANHNLTDNGSYWTVNLVDETGTALAGASVVVLSYCIF